MKHKLEIATVFGQVIGVASTIFMVWVFYNESFNGLGVLYYEPNRALAGFELLLAGAGLIIQAVIMSLMSLGMKANAKSQTEPSGYPKSGVPYQ